MSHALVPLRRWKEMNFDVIHFRVSCLTLEMTLEVITSKIIYLVRYFLWPPPPMSCGVSVLGLLFHTTSFKEANFVKYITSNGDCGTCATCPLDSSCTN